MISCLHLGLEAAQPLGRFAWTQPNAKEPAESTLRIMRRKFILYYHQT
jgi:regulator-associated protein of mTOR